MILCKDVEENLAFTEVKSLLNNDVVLPDALVKNNIAKSTQLQEKDSGLLQFKLRWISPQANSFIFEVPPSIQYITFTRANAGMVEYARKVHTIKIAVPRMILASVTSNHIPTNVWAYITPAGVYDPNDRIFSVPLPNIYRQSKICLANEGVRFDAENLRESMGLIYEAMWESRYNLDLVEMVRTSFSQVKPSLIYEKTMEKVLKRNRYADPSKMTVLRWLQSWSSCSVMEINSITDWPIPPSGPTTFGQLIADLAQYRTPNTQPLPRLERALIT